MTRHTDRQLLIAKAAVISVSGIVAGSFLGHEEGDYIASILVITAIFAIMAAAYEFLSGSLASLISSLEGEELITGLEESPVPEAAPAGFRPRDALKVLATFLGTQVVVWVVAVLAVVHPVGSDAKAIAMSAVLRAFPVALPLSMILSAFAVFLLGRRFAARVGHEDASRAFALTGAATPPLLVAAGAGFALAMFLALLAVVLPAGTSANDGFLAQVLANSATGRIVFGIAAVLIAPPVEEYVFRGVLLGTLLPLGEVVAGAISGVAFWLLHATEWVHYWPAAIGVGAMTVLVTMLRLRTKSIVPSITAHLFYNATLTAMALVG